MEDDFLPRTLRDPLGEGAAKKLRRLLLWSPPSASPNFSRSRATEPVETFVVVRAPYWAPGVSRERVESAYREAVDASSPLRSHARFSEFRTLRLITAIYDSDAIERLGMSQEETFKILVHLAENPKGGFETHKRGPDASE